MAAPITSTGSAGPTDAATGSAGPAGLELSSAVPGPHSVDPRTKLLALLVINALVLGNGTYSVCLSCFAVVAVLLAGARIPARYWWAYVVVFGCGAAGFILLPRLAPGGFIAFVALFLFWLSRFAVSMALAGYVLFTTRPAELSAALSRLRVPAAVVIPFSVMLRFIPTVTAELRAIIDAMRLRGLFPGALGILAHPVRTAEYVLVPLLASTTRITDDLSASALIRGLGSGPRPTSVIPLRLGAPDLAMLLVLTGLVVLRVSGWEVP